ncbi:alpha/beta fold hydrolase [Kitasatospora sp. NPDC059646]|uniref:alpha/beta fold hydrolase n=1 Tax=Kitasatospora sp. NPDC059646 TaxID=3346893 RepID=UPI003676B356
MAGATARSPHPSGDETTAPHDRHTHNHPDTASRTPRPRRRRWLARTADASGDQLVRLPGGDLHLAQDGPPDAPTVVPIHGPGGSTARWEPVLPALHDLRVVRVDLLGHGRSAPPADGWGIADQARRIGTALDRLGTHRATVAGHSTGGAVATSLAGQRRDLVTAIALVDTGPRLDAHTGDSLVGNPLTAPVLGELTWRLRADGTVRSAPSTAFTRKVQIPAQVVADIRGMTDRSLTTTDEATSAHLRERPIPDFEAPATAGPLLHDFAAEPAPDLPPQPLPTTARR